MAAAVHDVLDSEKTRLIPPSTALWISLCTKSAVQTAKCDEISLLNGLPKF